MRIPTEKYFDALKLRYDDQVQLLRFMTTIDLQVFGGFITLQTALGAWLATHPEIKSGTVRLGLVVIDLVLAALTMKLLHNQHRRRVEVQRTVKNLNEALGYNELGAYIEGSALNPTYESRPWFWWYIVGVVASTIGVLLVVFGHAAA